ncbi:MAG: pectinacetylesterase family protein [Gammaproteobacteria bacterium]|nr:pectinacetylesterase family protein [Gammaproteobacteria bacterium]
MHARNNPSRHNNKIKSLLARISLFALVAVLAACGQPEPAPVAVPDAESAADMTAAPVLADFSDLTPGWNAMLPGADTVCSDGSDYKFFVKQGDPQKVMFYLEGGGACWDGANCDTDLRPSYQVNLANTDPSQAHGILAFDQMTNPFADYTVVYAPYCSGDVHLGDAEQHHQAPALEGHASHAVHVRHRGLVNASSAMAWMFEHVFSPQQIFVTGSSAGSIPSPFYAVKIAEQYPAAAVTQLGDASGGYRGFANFSPYDIWDTDRVVADLSHINSIPADQFSFHHLYIAAAQENANIRYASYDNAEDDVQKQFLALGGTPVESLQPLLEQNLAEISTAIPRFRYYVAGGTMHTILLRPEVYTYEVNGTKFIDWLAGLETGAPVFNVMCDDCSVAPAAMQGAQ